MIPMIFIGNCVMQRAQLSIINYYSKLYNTFVYRNKLNLYIFETNE